MNRAELKNILKRIEKDLPKPTGLGSKKNGGPIKKLKKLNQEWQQKKHVDLEEENVVKVEE